MSKAILVALGLVAGLGLYGFSLLKLAEDTFPASGGELKVYFVGHGSLFLAHGGKVIHVDPVGSEGDYASFPKADLILVTHEHGDHLDAAAIGLLGKDGTRVIVSSSCAGRIPGAMVMANGDRKIVDGIEVEAVPAYNVLNKRPDGNPFHPKGRGNGYVIGLGGMRIYVAGDTENIPEMAALKGIDIAFLPMNLPYTMTPEMVAEAARAFRPKVLYPYHFGQTDAGRLLKLLETEPAIEVRVRPMS